MAKAGEPGRTGSDSTPPAHPCERRPRLGTAPSAAAGTLALLALLVLPLLVGGCGGEEVHTVPAGSVLLDPDDAAFSGPAPDTYRARFQTSRGSFVVEVVREWAPVGADRFHHLVRNGFYDGARFYRAMEGFVAQFGLHGDPAVSAAWRERRIADDPVNASNWRGSVSFATAGPGTRTTEVFINLHDNLRLDAMGFAPFGRVVDRMNVVERLYTGYGDGPPDGQGPDPARIQREGNAYLIQQFPALDRVVRATIVQED